jgi:hypothetical protein
VAPMSGLSLAILLAGLLIISSLEVANQRRRRARRAGTARVAINLSTRPSARESARLTRRRHGGVE